MIRRLRLFIILLALPAVACQQSSEAALCSAEWNSAVDAAVQSGDGQGHGPDVGSDEWKSVIEFKLGVRGYADVPARNSTDWCQYVEQRLP